MARPYSSCDLCGLIGPAGGRYTRRPDGAVFHLCVSCYNRPDETFRDLCGVRSHRSFGRTGCKAPECQVRQVMDS